MPSFSCPICGAGLILNERSYRCNNNHCYDLSKQNYVNLLMKNSSSGKRHGDDKLMVSSRREFLDAGYYSCLKNAVCSLALKYSGESAELLDIGCGEGYYTSAIKNALSAAGKKCSAAGIDISREALIAAGKRDNSLSLAVASINRLPFADESLDILVNIFAPEDNSEFLRVLRRGGIIIRAVPREEHLLGLKAAVYDKPYLNPPAEYTPEGFKLLEMKDVDDEIIITSSKQINNLFMMTPYYYKTSASDQAKLLEISELKTQLCFRIFVMMKN